MIDASLDGIDEKLEESDLEALVLDFSNSTRSSVKSEIKKVATSKGIGILAFNPRALETLYRDPIVKTIITTADEALATRHLGLDFSLETGDLPTLKVVKHEFGSGPFERSGLDLSTTEAINRSKRALDLFCEAHEVLGGEVFPRLQKKALFDEKLDLGDLPNFQTEPPIWRSSMSFPSSRT